MAADHSDDEKLHADYRPLVKHPTPVTNPRATPIATPKAVRTRRGTDAQGAPCACSCHETGVTHPTACCAP